jgi:phosphatidylglycerol:prolipoprotein diacylglycerol transferase
MIPFIRQPQLSAGPVTLHAFGVLAACAILVGAEVLKRRAVRHGIDPVDAGRFTIWIVVGGFIGAHLVDRLIYFPAQTLADPWSLVRVWQGISSFGGFLGGAAAGLWFLRTRAAPGTAWHYADAFAYAFPFAWVLGRIGCFLAFDHPGLETGALVGQMDARGVVRHNLGLYEAIYMLPLVFLFVVLGRRPRSAGFFVALLVSLYAPLRFALDYLRLVDVRYLGLTPGQYGALALTIAAAALWWTLRRSPGPAPGTC